MMAAGGERIARTVFYAANGRRVEVPSRWFSGNGAAMGLSRSAMDNLLLERAVSVGAVVYPGASVTALRIERGRVLGAEIKTADGSRTIIEADVFVDATGRTRHLAKLADRARGKKQSSASPEFVAFKAHLYDARPERGACEIYSFPAGYGGLDMVENERSNFCFVVRSQTARKFGGRADSLINEVVMRNVRARETLSDAQPCQEWMAVAIEGFGQRQIRSAKNLFSVGDAAAFIDPFTGSGILMSLEGSDIFARVLSASFPDLDNAASEYSRSFNRTFSKRLLLCRSLRRAAYRPLAAGMLISALSASSGVRRLLALSTRPSETSLHHRP
jgi:flavin-dependent dehydrogenase